jgi:hypothetical protein
MDSQRIARIFGILFLLTFVTSIAALALFQSVLDDPAGYIAGGGEDNRIYLGAFLDLLLVLANVGTAVVLYPIVSRTSCASWYPMERATQATAAPPGTRPFKTVSTFSGPHGFTISAFGAPNSSRSFWG